jgi:two-component system sensor histidine kinase RstB
MTRLFLRFYLGVLFILLCAWCIQAYMYSRDPNSNRQGITEWLGGGARLACERLAEPSPQDRPAALHELQQYFDYPVSIIAANEVSPYERDQLSADNDVLATWRNGLFILAPLPNSNEVLQLGPLRNFYDPSQAEWVTGLTTVLLLTAVAIALLLRPVAKQLRLVEDAAVKIAGGDLSARVDESKVASASTLASAFNNMASRSETMVRTQRELLQAVSHELRTPLSRIQFSIDLIRDAKDSQQRETRLVALERAADELDDLVGELLTYVRIETSELAQCQLETALLPVLEEQVEKHALLYPEMAFEIDEAIRGDTFTVPADVRGLERAFGNLLANAGRFAKSRVVMSASESPRGTVVDVDDDGPGIESDDRLRVFDPFVRLDDENHGVGLGLALVRRIVVNQGGSVAAMDSPLGGCRIRLVWPRGDRVATKEGTTQK